MNLLADESVDQPIVDLLRQEGYSVLCVSEMEPSISDDMVLSRADRHGALLVTGDKDFGELVFRQRLIHSGVVLIRLAGLSPSAKAEIVARAFRSHAHEFGRNFVVISPGMIRVRQRL